MPENYIYNIKTKPVVHMAAQARAKQLATKSSQDRLLEDINNALENNNDVSGEAFVKSLSQDISKNINIMEELKTQHPEITDFNIVGFPIKFNKTIIQLNTVSKWVEEKGENLLSDIKNKVLYHGFSNNYGIDQLAQLTSSSNKAFWGNENPSVSTVLLYSVASTLGLSPKASNLMGAATFYPFFKEGYKVAGITENPFVSEYGMVLFGDYQYGAHRYFSNSHPHLGQRIFSPEDCSTAVGKATNLTENQIVGIHTGALKEAYKNPSNSYGYKAITSSDKENLEIEQILPGDIYVRGGHCAIVTERDNSGIIQVLEFNRDIDSPQNKMLGGGINKYNLSDLVHNDPENKAPIYILRSTGSELKEEVCSSCLIERIDENFDKFYEHTKQDMPGDCGMFLDGEF